MPGEERRAAKSKLESVHPAFASCIRGSSKDKMGGGKGLDHGSQRLALRTLARPDGLVHGMEKLEAEAILLRGSLYQLAGREDDRPDPVTALSFL